MLKTSIGKVEAALQQNETVNIFMDAMANVGDDDGTIGSKMENQLKELRNFTDLDFSKGKSLACIDWHPTTKGVIGVSVCKTMSFDERVEVSGQVRGRRAKRGAASAASEASRRKDGEECVVEVLFLGLFFTLTPSFPPPQVDVAYVIIWEFTEWIKPQLVLQSPHETFTFKFNPTMPNVVCGGCYSGQAIMWDLNDAMGEIERKKQDKKSKDDGDDEDEEER